MHTSGSHLLLLATTGSERIARTDVPTLHSTLEPGDALRRTAMCEALRTYRTSTHLLQVVVTHGSRRFQRVRHVRLVQLSTRLHRMSPDARITVCLQLQPYRQGIPLSWVRSHSLRHFSLCPQDILHMMPQFMGHNVALRKVACVATDTLQLVPEAQIDIDLLVLRAVEGASGTLGVAASTLDLVTIEHQPGTAIVLARLLRQQRHPHLLHVIQHKRDELRLAVLRRALLHRLSVIHTARLLLPPAPTHTEVLADVVPARHETYQEQYTYTNDPQAATTADAKSTAATGISAPVLNIITNSTRRPLHRPYPH